MRTNATALQLSFLQRFASNDIVRDYGWQDPNACAWISDLCVTRSDSAIFGSLLTANLMWSNEESCGLTDSGRAVLATVK